jgi:hypothetical protein
LDVFDITNRCLVNGINKSIKVVQVSLVIRGRYVLQILDHKLRNRGYKDQCKAQIEGLVLQKWQFLDRE